MKQQLYNELTMLKIKLIFPYSSLSYIECNCSVIYIT